MTQRPLWNFWCSWTSHLSIKSSDLMANSQCLPCYITPTLHRKRNSWSKFPMTSSRTPWRRRSLWSWVNYQIPKKRMKTSIPCKMERLPDYQCNMGKWIGILWWWQHAVNLQRLTSTIIVNMPYEFDEELCQLIVEIRGIWNDLLSMQLKLFGSHPSVAVVP